MKQEIDLLNPYVYIPSFLKIRTKAGSLEPFKPNLAQIKLLDTIEQVKAKNEPVRIIILKARQMGFSTMTEAVCFKDTVTKKWRKSLIIAHEDQASQNLYNMFKTYYFNLPEALMPMRKKNNSQELIFENPTMDDIEKRRNPGLMSSVKIATAGNKGAGRSDTIHFLHCSEVAFWSDAKTTVTGLFQTVPLLPDTTIILESTANGVGGYFYETWKKAENGENNFIPLFFPWFDEPSYSMPFNNEEEKNNFIEEVNYSFKDNKGNVIHTEEYDLIEMFPNKISYEQLKWRRWCIANNCYGDIEKFHQEYPSYPDEAFIASGRPKFNTSVLKRYRTRCKEGFRCDLHETSNGIEEIPNKKGYVEIFEEPREDAFYTIGADVAEGLITGDYSNAYVLDTNLKVVAKWRGHIDADLFGEELVKLAKHYNNAYLGVEANNHGHATLKAIQRKEYFNIYFAKIYDGLADKITQKVGWQTNTKTKPLMIDKLAEFIRNKYFDVCDIDFINECLTYVIDEKGATNAQDGCHDDCVMSMAIALQLFLEGKSESFVPTAPNDTIVKKKKRFDMFEVSEDTDNESEFGEFGFNQEVSN